MKKSNNGKLATGWIVGISILAIILILVLWVVGVHNSLVNSEVNVDKSFANVESVYQRRADLIPNLVETVKGSANFEQETQTKIAELRTQATQVKTEISSAQTPEQLEAAATKLDSVVSGYRSLNINVENYPELKSNTNFLALQDELANTENKIAVERQRYNDAVSDFNKKIRTIPSNMVASMFGFESRTFFDAESGAENAPDVSFN